MNDQNQPMPGNPPSSEAPAIATPPTQKPAPPPTQPAPHSQNVTWTTSFITALLMFLVNLGVFGAWALVTNQPSGDLSDANALLFLIAALLIELLGFFSLECMPQHAMEKSAPA